MLQNQSLMRVHVSIHALIIAALLAGLIPPPIFSSAAKLTDSTNLRQAAKFVEAALPQPAIALASGAISGTVFEDTNLNGSLTSGESGLGAVAVTVFDASGATCAASTSASGAYSINTATCGSLSAGPYRVEFALPTSLNYLEPSIAGGTTVQFVNDGGGTANAGFHDPADYCDNNPNLATSCYRNGSGSADVLYSWNYNNSGLISQGRPAPTREADNTQIGATWGLAYERSTGSLYAAAFLKRHSALIDNDNDSQGDLGAIYRLSVDGNSGNDNNPLWLDLDGAIDSNSNPIAVGTIANNSGRGIPASTTGPSADADAFFKVAKVGLGDIDINPSETMLWVVNVFQKTLHSVVVNPDGTPGTIDTYAIPTNQCNGSGATNDTQPFAVKYHNGGVYVGLVCSGEFTQSLSTMRAYVYRLPDDGVTTTFTEVLNFSLNYPRERVDVNGSCGSITTWRPWVTSFPSNCDSGSGTYVVPQPILSDIEFDSADGDMMVGFFDRWGHQSGPSNYDINGNNNVRRPVTGGEVLRATPNGNGAFTIESNIASGGEFYQDDFVDTGNGSGHFEFSVGGLAHLPGSSDLVLTVFDPIDGQGSQGIFVSGGVAFLSNTNGSKNNARGYQIYQLGSSPDTFGKAAGLGDLELLCDSAPLEIGNRVWQDADSDGIQDPGEAGINGVRVTLHNMDSGGAQVGAAQITSGDGGYLFTNLNPRTSYQVRVSLTDGSLPANSVVTQANQNGDSTNNNKSDLHDSDGDNGVLNAGFSTIAFTAGGPGGNNHTLDFGFAPDAAKGNIQVTKNIAAGSDAANVAHWEFTITSTTPGCDLPAPYDTNPALTTATGANGQTVTFVDLLVDDGGSPATTCQYSVEETNIPNGWQTTVATLNPQTSLTVTDAGMTEITFTNEQLFDYSDNPDTYGATNANGGGYHAIGGPYLGATVDAETDGFPSANADGDDNDGAPDDEDGVTFANTLAVTNTSYAVNIAVVNPYVPTTMTATDDLSVESYSNGSGWLGDWVEAGTDTGQDPAAGQIRVNLNALRISAVGNSLTRPVDFSGATSGNLAFDFSNRNGGFDQSANPLLVQVSTDGVNYTTIGAFTDATATYQPKSIALNSTHFNSNGATYLRFANGGTGLANTEGYFVDNIEITGTIPANPVAVVGWIDFDLSGAFEADEAAIITDVASGSHTLTWNAIPGDIQAGDTYARFRISSDASLTTSYVTGLASDGEIEDYPLTISSGDGVITIVKNTSGSDATFNFSSADADLNAVSITTVGGVGRSAAITKSPGAYTISEDVLSGWLLDSIDISGIDGATSSTTDTVNYRAVINLDAGDAITVTFTNAEATPSLALNKQLNGVNPFGVGETISFTIRITNTGDVAITTLPLEDRFSSAFITFVSADPALDGVNGSILTWNNLLAGDPDGLAVNETISVDVTFTTMADTTLLPAVANCSPAGQAPNMARSMNAFAGASPVVKDVDDEDCASVQILNPTTIQLANRSLTQTPGGVLVQWQMVEESNVVGFYVWRSNGVESTGRSELITTKVNGEAVEAMTHEWLDVGATLQRGDVYVLEILKVDGSSERVVINVATGISLYLPLLTR